MPPEPSLGYISKAEPSELYQWGLEVIRAIQGIEHPLLTGIIRFLTALGSVYCFVPLILLILWCVDEKKGLRLGMLLCFSAWINGMAKTLLKQPRPYDLDPSVGRGFEKTFGMPSGHAQLSLTFWIPLAYWRNHYRLLAWGGAALLSLIIGFTRLYLGLHFPTDLLGGWLLGILLLGMYFWAEPFLERFLIRGETRLQLIGTAAVAWGMNALGGDRNLGGCFLGFGLGYGLMLRHFPFSARGPVRGKKPGFLLLGARYALGMTGGILLYGGLKLLLPGEASLFGDLPFMVPYYELGSFIRYGFLGFWASAGAPWLFIRLGIAQGSIPKK